MRWAGSTHKTPAGWPDLPVILVSGTVGEETAVELLRLGLSDFVLKDSLARLPAAIRRTLGEADERRARRAAEAALRESQTAALEEQRQARLAALNLMEDALAARHRAEEANTALVESEQRLLMAQEGAHVGVWEWDVRSNQVKPARLAAFFLMIFSTDQKERSQCHKFPPKQKCHGVPAADQQGHSSSQ